ncbi:MAG TPA: hypothetical protein VK654_03295, partial [Nitrospirota bacterium]|nr:hypothetical protein [Nitrospirota bacterium]
MKSIFAVFRNLLHATVLPAVLVVIWEILSRQGLISPHVLPAPTQVFLRWIAYAKPLEPYDPATMHYIVW